MFCRKEKWVKYNGKKMYLGSDGTFVKDTWIDDKYLGAGRRLYQRHIVMTDVQTKVKPDGLDTVSSGDIIGRTNW